jgi:hypothetical protein
MKRLIRIIISLSILTLYSLICAFCFVLLIIYYQFKAMKNQVEVRNITKKISQLNTKLDAVNQLSEPRENSYILFQRSNKSYDDVVKRLLTDVGKIKTSKTFPSLCRVTMETSIANLETTAKVQTIDYHGQIQVCSLYLLLCRKYGFVWFLLH